MRIQQGGGHVVQEIGVFGSYSGAEYFVGGRQEERSQFRIHAVEIRFVRFYVPYHLFKARSYGGRYLRADKGQVGVHVIGKGQRVAHPKEEIGEIFQSEERPSRDFPFDDGGVEGEKHSRNGSNGQKVPRSEIRYRERSLKGGGKPFGPEFGMDVSPLSI